MFENLRNGVRVRDRRNPQALRTTRRTLQGVDSEHALHQLREAVAVKREHAAAAAGVLKTRWSGRQRKEADKYRDLLVELYGEEKGRAIQFAETFELSEYGRQP